MVEYVKPETVSLKLHPEVNEAWIQNLIADDPSVLGLGELELRQKERIQPGAGRLDLLLQDPDTRRRFEIELQLGATDETHIIRTVEYWDIERKRYPQYDHCAVIVAEDITSRFLNVLSLFNGSIPLIAIRMQGLVVAGKFTIVFTRVLDELTRGLVDEDEDAEAAPATRSYWEERASRASLNDVDALLAVAKEIDPTLELRYNRHYIGLTKNQRAFNFIGFRPRRAAVNFELKLPKTDEIDARIEEASIEPLEYSGRWGLYRLRLTPEDVRTKKDIIKQLIELAYQRRSA